MLFSRPSLASNSLICLLGGTDAFFFSLCLFNFLRDAITSGDGVAPPGQVREEEGRVPDRTGCRLAGLREASRIAFRRQPIRASGKSIGEQIRQRLEKIFLFCFVLSGEVRNLGEFRRRRISDNRAVFRIPIT